jgi:hypothetical protein
MSSEIGEGAGPAHIKIKEKSGRLGMVFREEAM